MVRILQVLQKKLSAGFFYKASRKQSYKMIHKGKLF